MEAAASFFLSFFLSVALPPIFDSCKPAQYSSFEAKDMARGETGRGFLSVPKSSSIERGKNRMDKIVIFNYSTVPQSFITAKLYAVVYSPCFPQPFIIKSSIRSAIQLLAQI